jgi:polar amino acid transport system substrate-binding protein
MSVGKVLTALIIFFSLAAYSQTPSGPGPAVRAELIPTGKLRVGLILSNAVLVTKDPQSGELRGVTIDLGRELAARLGVPFEPVGYANPAKLAESFGSNAWDIAFIAIDPARATVVDFSHPYMEVDNSCHARGGTMMHENGLAIFNVVISSPAALVSNRSPMLTNLGSASPCRKRVCQTCT